MSEQEAKESTIEVMTNSKTDERAESDASREAEKVDIQTVDKDGADDESEELSAKPNEEADGDDGSDVDQDAKPKKKSGFQKRINKLNARVQAERDANEYLMRRIRELEAKNTPNKSEEKAAAVNTDEKPSADNFDTYEEYIEAIAEWKAEQKLAAAKKHDEEKAKSESFEAKKNAHNQRVDAYKKSHPDFEDAIQDFIAEHGREFDIPKVVTELIAESENGPAILHELFRNPQELLRFNSMSDTASVLMLGRIEERLEMQKTQAKETKRHSTNAPPPLTPVKAKGASVAKTIFDAQDQAEYERIRRAEMKRNSAWG